MLHTYADSIVAQIDLGIPESEQPFNAVCAVAYFAGLEEKVGMAIAKRSVDSDRKYVS